MTNTPSLDQLWRLAQRIRATDDRISHPEDAPDTFAGVPITTSENAPRDKFLTTGSSIFMHPQTRHALRIALTEHPRRKLSDPLVQLEASLAWIQDRIDQRVERVLRDLDRLPFAFAARDVARDAAEVNAS